MLWTLWSMCSGQTFSPFSVSIWDEPSWWKQHASIKPVHLSINLELLIQVAVALKNEHSLENDLDDLDNVKLILPAELPPHAPPMNRWKHPCSPNPNDASHNSHQHVKRWRVHYEQSLSNEQSLTNCTQQLMKDIPIPIHTSLQTEGLSVAKGAYTAVAQKEVNMKRVHSIEELINGHGFCLVEWGDGWVKPHCLWPDWCPPRWLQPIIDAKNCVVAIIAGQPSDPSYSCSCMETFNVMAMEENAACFRKGCEYCRGAFPTVNVGISYGKGQRVPSRLQNGTLLPWYTAWWEILPSSEWLCIQVVSSVLSLVTTALTAVWSITQSLGAPPLPSLQRTPGPALWEASPSQTQLQKVYLPMCDIQLWQQCMGAQTHKSSKQGGGLWAWVCFPL